MSLFNALKTSSVRHDDPYVHWEILRPFSADVLREVEQTVIADVRRDYDGTRAGDAVGPASVKTRCYVSRENIDQFPALSTVVDELLARETIDCVSEMLQRSIQGYLRIEVIADRDGFWLKPHTDIREKLMTLLVYVNPYNESESLGTDIYDSNFKRVKTVPYRQNYGYMFAPADNTWHGLEKKDIVRERRSVLINYVTFPTDWPLPTRAALRRAG